MCQPPVSCGGSGAAFDVRKRRNGNGDASGHGDPKRYSRAALFGVVAAREAWNDAGLAEGEPDAGVIIGSGGGGIDVGERQYQDFFVAGGQRVTPYAIAIGICGMVSSEISIALQLHGISHVLSTGCTSSTDAIGYAAMLLRNGDFDVLLTGGTDGCVLASMIFGFSRMRAVSTHYNDRAARRLAAVRSRPRRVRARRRRVDGGARARRSRAGARRAHVRDGRRLREHVRRLPPRADGPRRRSDRPLHDARRSRDRDVRSKRSATSTTTARRRS